MKWFELKLFIRTGVCDVDRDQFYDTIWPILDEVVSSLRENVNNALNPRYKEIVGKTIPKLEKVDIERTHSVES
jgi:hypothetical protein